MKFFETIFLNEADRFIASLDPKTAKKVFYNVRIAEQTNDPKLFKKLKNEIWEFRTKFLGVQIRVLAFWDKEDNQRTLVLATNGFVKKRDKIPDNEIQKAVQIRKSILTRKEKTITEMENEEMKMYTLDEMEDKYISKKGTPEREEYEYELQMEMLSRMIKSARKERNLTQEQLGKLVGVKKAQISKLEKGANSATIDTIIKVFKALKAEIHFNVKLENQNIRLA